MDRNIINSDINLCKTALDGYFEEKVDLDITIPDYSPAAEKIIKCDVIPIITSHSFDSERMNLDGICTVNVMYTDEQTGQIKSISESVNFSHTYPLKENLDNLRTKMKLRTSNVLCRLQNSRRISVKTVIGIALKVMGNSKCELISGFEDAEVESYFESATFCPYINCGEGEINVTGEIHSDYPVSDIIKYNADMLVTDVKVINDRAVIKGNAVIECLYTTGERVDDIECSNAVVPFSEIIDIPEAVEDDLCDTELFVTGLHLEIGNSNENNIINFEIDGRAIASVFRDVSVKLLKDVYSKTNKIECEKETILVETLVKRFNFTDTVNDTIDVSLEDAVVKCINTKANVKNVSVDENNIVLEGDVVFSVIAHNGSEYCVYDKTSPFRVMQEISGEFTQIRCEANVICENVSFSMPSDNSLECKAALRFNCMVFSKNSYEVINSVNMSDEAAEGKLCSKIVLYYASRGEKLWDIAKKYSISVENIKQHNNLDCEALSEDKMLLISSK